MGPGAGVEHNIHHCFLFLCPWVLSAAVGALESRVVGGILHKCDFLPSLQYAMTSVTILSPLLPM